MEVIMIFDKTRLLTKNGVNYLYCEKKVPSSYGNEDSILFLLEQTNLTPILPVFSTLRNTFIDVNNLEDIEKIFAEDTKYKKIIEKNLDNSYDTAEKILLRSFQ